MSKTIPFRRVLKTSTAMPVRQGQARATVIRSKTNDASQPYMTLINKGDTPKQLADPFVGWYGQQPGSTFTPIQPFYPFEMLVRAGRQNSTLNQCIEAYVVNIESYGYQLQYVGPPGKEKSADAKAQKGIAMRFLECPNGDISLKQVREETRKDLEYLGNRFFEIGESESNVPLWMNALPATTMRITQMDPAPTDYEVEVPTPDGYETVTFSKRFRRFMQISSTGRRVYFKEFGDPRPIDPTNGQVNPALAIEDQATSVYWERLYMTGAEYGVPRWIGTLPVILGTRESELVNLNFFRENAIPAMAILISGGALTEESIDKVSNLLNGARGTAAMNRILVLEAAADNTVATTDQAPPAPKIEMKPMISERQSDGLFKEYEDSGKKKIRSSMRLPAVYTGDCYSEDTQFLTQTGWKLYRDIKKGEKVGTFNKETGAVEYQRPIKYHEYDYDGEMVAVKSKCIDALVTPRHLLVWRQYRAAGRNKKNVWSTDRAEVVENFRGAMQNAIELPTAAIFNGTRKSVRIAGRKYDLRWLAEFVGYFASEGSFGTSTGIRLHQNEGSIADKMRACLNGRVRWSENKTRGNQVTFTVSDRGLKDWLAENVGTYSYNKRIPAIFKDATVDAVNALIQALYDGDGSDDTLSAEGAFTYSTTSRQLADDLQALCVTRGLTCSQRVHHYNDGVRKDSYRLYVSPRDTRIIRTDQHMTRVTYKGKIVCFTVPNHTLITRRNGKVLLANNTDEYTKASAQTGQRIAEGQVFMPERGRFDDFVNRRILAKLGVNLWKYKTMGPTTYDPDTLGTLLNQFAQNGAMTPNVLIKIANQVLDVQIHPITDAWGDIPFDYTLNAINGGLIVEGFEDIFASISDITGENDPVETDEVPPANTANDNNKNKNKNTTTTTNTKQKPKGKVKAEVRAMVRKEMHGIANEIIRKINEQLPKAANGDDGDNVVTLRRVLRRAGA